MQVVGQMGRFEFSVNEIVPQRVMHYQVRQNDRPMSYAQVIELWQKDDEFCRFTSHSLASSPFTAFRWETPACSVELSARPFEYVLVDAPRLASRRPDTETFRSFFMGNHGRPSVVTFPNLGGDALLIVPSPRADPSAYGHLAAFVRGAPDEQNIELWKSVGLSISQKLSNRPVWLSTAGGGVAWLHVRIDRSPKYYAYTPYSKHTTLTRPN